MDPAQRGRILNKMAAATYAKAKELAVIESSNNSKTFREALSEIRYGAWTLEYFAGLADKIEGSTIPVPGPRLNYTLRQPLGVTAHIVPWNFPLQLALRSIAPALAAGCTVIAKPASWTPLSLIAWSKAIDEAETGLPSGVLQVLTGSGALAGDALAGHAGVDGVVLTGGVPTGKTVMAKASEQLTPVTSRLGGKGANIVFPDANLRYAAKAICFGIFMNAGQMCWAGSRLLVHEDVHDDLVEARVLKWASGPLGPAWKRAFAWAVWFMNATEQKCLRNWKPVLPKAVPCWAETPWTETGLSWKRPLSPAWTVPTCCSKTSCSGLCSR